MKKLEVALLGILFATPALAQPKARYTRAPNVVVDVKLSDRTQPVTPRPAPARRPVVSSELALSIEGLRGQFQAQQERILRDLIRQTPDADVDDKADLYFRLGELLAKQHRFWRLKTTELAIAAEPPLARLE